jgi:hypothetical protein
MRNEVIRNSYSNCQHLLHISYVNMISGTRNTGLNESQSLVSSSLERNRDIQDEP